MDEKIKIMVVEDETIVGIDLINILVKLNYKVIDLIRTGEEAIKKSSEEKPDLILMDIMLNGKINGIEAAEQIKNIINIPIVYLTAYADSTTLENAKITEPSGYLLKPFDERTLLSTIETALYKHKIETRLKESEERYRSLVELSPIAIGIYLDDKVVYANPAGVKLFGASSTKELLGKTINNFIHPDFLDIVKKRIDLTIKRGHSVEIPEVKLIRLDRKIIDVEIVIIPSWYQGKSAIQIVLRDITEEKRKAQVQQSSLRIIQSVNLTNSLGEFYENLHHILKDYIHIDNLYIALHDENNKLTFPYFKDEFILANEVDDFDIALIKKIIKDRKSVLLKRSQVEDFASSNDYKFYGTNLQSLLAVPFEIHNLTGLLLVKEYYNEDAQTEKEMELLEQLSYSISRSIERKMLEEERKLYTEKLKELNSTKDQFFSIISHDLRSPFDSILGFTEILKNEYNELSDNEIKLFIDSLFQSSRHIYSLLNNLLQFSRFQLGKMEFDPQNLPLYNIVEKNIEILKGNALKKQINLINKVKAGFVVYADKEMLNSIILNLVTNAIKFTGRGGDVIISSVNNDKFVEVSVVDTGIGMDKKTLVDLFKLDVKKSTPGTENESGTGLGLMLTKEFVENNGGKIAVKSSPNKGTCFSFTLPLAKSG